jgi:GH24 family phage-related lysozyme (muramidase)
LKDWSTECGCPLANDRGLEECSVPGDASTPLWGEQYDRLKTELLASYAGADNAGRPMLLEGGLSWQAMSLSPADMDFIALKGAAARDIALAFGVPPMLLGLPGDATYANYREANKALWRQTILPLAFKLLGAIAEGLRPWFAKLELGVDLDAVTALSEDRERLWAQVSGVDFLTLNEKREAVGLAAIELPEVSKDAPDTAMGDPVETKINVWHDRDDGQFTEVGNGIRSDGSSGESASMAERPKRPKLPPGKAPATGGLVSGTVTVSPTKPTVVRILDGRTIINQPTVTYDKPTKITAKPAETLPIRVNDGRIIINQATASFDNPDYPRVSATGRKLITESEGSRLSAYVPRGSISSGVTIGYGYDLGSRNAMRAKAELLSAGVDEPTAAALSSSAGLTGNGALNYIRDSKIALTITSAHAEALFDDEARAHVTGVLSAIKRPLSQNQFDALVSLHYNYPRAVRGKMASLINDGKFIEAAGEFDKYIYGTVADKKTKKRVKVVMPGLKTRRSAEKRLFLGK